MAQYAPLFVSSHTDLRARLRLSRIENSQDAASILDEAIVSVRVKFITRLTQARIDQILLTSYTEAPTTNDQFIRTLASVTETKMVRLELLLTLPTSKMDASGDTLKRWNEEAPFREMDADELEKLIEKLQAEIDQAMELLAGEDEAGDDSAVNTWDGSPDTPTPALGDSLCRQYASLIRSENS